MCLYYIITGQFAMSHGSYDLNLGSEILILGGDISSRSWPNIGGTYGTYPNNKYLFGIGIWIWAAKNQGFR
jgi:hypothetical protein